MEKEDMQNRRKLLGIGTCRIRGATRYPSFHCDLSQKATIPRSRCLFPETEDVPVCDRAFLIHNSNSF